MDFIWLRWGAKCIALGASLVAFASPMLRLADLGVEATIEGVKLLEEELRTAMFGIGAANLSTLIDTPHLLRVTNG